MIREYLIGLGVLVCLMIYIISAAIVYQSEDKNVKIFEWIVLSPILIIVIGAIILIPWMLGGCITGRVQC